MKDQLISINKLLHQILLQEGDTHFYRFVNTDQKQWFIPQRQMTIGLNIYQPVSLKGKLLKKGLPYIKHWDWLLRVLGMEKRSYRLNDDLMQLLSGLFGTKHLEFSLFGGTPSVHQKITIQLSSGKTILGYCKLSDQEEIKKIFRHEKQILEELKNKGVEQIPQCMFCGNLTKDVAVFVQTTLKTNASKIPDHWSEYQGEFLRHLHEQTRTTLPFEQTDFYRILTVLPSRTRYLSADKVKIIASAIEYVSCRYSAKDVDFSVFHADFTPWNMFVEQGRLFVFDFEYAQRTYPPYLDWFHFFTQTGIFNQRMNATSLFQAYQKQKTSISKYFIEPDFLYQCYLLSVIELYLARENEQPPSEIMSMLTTWIDLLLLLQNATEK